MGRMLSFLKVKDWLLFILFVFFVFIQVMLSLSLPENLTAITSALKLGNADMSTLIMPGIAMIICAVGSVVSAIIGGVCIARISASIVMRMREATVEKIISFSLAEMSGFSSSSLITRSTNDIMQIQMFTTMGTQVMVQCPMLAIFAILKMGSNTTWLIAAALMVVFIILLHVVVIILVQKKSMLVQKLVDNVNRVTREHVSGMRVVHAYNGYTFQEKQFDKVNDDLTKTSLFVNRSVGVLSPFLSMAINALSLIIYLLGAVMINDTVDSGDRLTLFSDMIVFSSYALQAMGAFVFMLLAVIMLPRFLVSLKRVNEIINAKNSIEDGKFESGANGMVGSIEFRNVSFAYPGASGNAISDISFKVERGMTLAIIGSTGSGKTTLMNLIPRLYDATEGVILVDGRDVRDYKIWALRDKIGYVPQKSFLFAGTIASNIDYGQKSGLQATLNEIKKAAEVGQSKEFIENKEGNYQAKVEEGGTNFSGGQRQRLTISRAICRDPEIYLFDDSFSALDFKTDSVLRKQLRSSAKDSTQIIVGQRIGSIKNADMILVLDKGRLVGQGKHEELLKTCDVYREIALSQLSSEEAV